MAKDYKYICTECYWHGSEDDLETRFRKNGDEQVCPKCGAFEQCAPQNDVCVISQGDLISICLLTELHLYINLGWVEEQFLTVEDFLRIKS